MMPDAYPIYNIFNCICCSNGSTPAPPHLLDSTSERAELSKVVQKKNIDYIKIKIVPLNPDFVVQLIVKKN